MRTTKRHHLGLAVVIAAGIGVLAPAWTVQAAAPYDLSQVTPDKALVYIGWSGASADVATEATAWSKLRAEPEVAAMLDTLWPTLKTSLLGLAQKEGKDEGRELAEQGMALAEILWDSPLSLSVGQIVPREDGPGISAYLIVRAKERSAEIQTHIEALLKRGLPPEAFEPTQVGDVQLVKLAMPGMPLPVYYGVAGEYFVVAVGQESADVLIKTIEGGAPSLAASERFGATMKNAGGTENYITGYLDVKAGLATFKMFQPMLAMARVPVLGDAETFQKILDETGISKVQAIGLTLRPEAQGFMSRLFVYAPGAAETPAPAFDEAALAVVPADAHFFCGFNMDLAKTYDKLMSIFGQVAEKEKGEFDRELAKAEEELGLKIRDDILAPIGTNWLIYDWPHNGGVLFTGITASVDLRDADHFQDTIEKLLGLLQKEAKGKVTVELDTYRGQIIAYVNVIGVPMPFAPAWMIQGNRLTIALFPQILRAVVDQQKDKLPSIVDNTDYQRARKLMPKEVGSLSYMNTARGVNAMYPFVLPLAEVASAMAQGEKVDIKVGMLPSLHTLTKHLYGTISASSCTDQGWLMVSHGPLPVAVPGGGFAAAPALAMSIALPALARAREQARMTVDASNMKQLAIAGILYAEEHRGEMPKSLDDLRGGKTLPPQVIGQLEQRGRLEYVGGQMNTYDPRNVVAYMMRYSGGEPRYTVAFLDGHVESVHSMRFDQIMKETQEQIEEAKKNAPAEPAVEKATEEKANEEKPAEEKPAEEKPTDEKPAEDNANK